MVGHYYFYLTGGKFEAQKGKQFSQGCSLLEAEFCWLQSPCFVFNFNNVPFNGAEEIGQYDLSVCYVTDSILGSLK